MSLETIIEVDETASIIPEKETPFLLQPRKNWDWLQVLKYVIVAIILLALGSILIAIFVEKYKAV